VKYFALILFCILCFSACNGKKLENINENKQKIQETEIKTVSELLREENKEEKFEPLNENDFFELKYDEQINSYIVYKITADKSSIYYIPDTDWGTCELSSDKKQVLIERNGRKDIYLLDGNTGNLNFLREIKNEFCPSQDFQFMIITAREQHLPALEVRDMLSFEKQYYVTWDIDQEYDDFGGFQIVRYSNETFEELKKNLQENDIIMKEEKSNYDCIIYASAQEGNTCYGYALFDTSTKMFITHNIVFERYF